MHVIGGSAGSEVASDLATILGAEMLALESKRFPDDERYVRILSDIQGEQVIVVQTTYPDENIIELLLLLDAVAEAGARKIILVIPYMGYSRQDKKFKDGEAISARAIAQALSPHVDIVIAVDPHKQEILEFFDAKAVACSAIEEIAEALKKKQVDFILAPDKGALASAKTAAKIIGCEYDYMEKTRIDGETVKIKPKSLDAKGRRVGIIDDIISTGGTMAKSIAELKKQNAKEIFVCCTHGLFVGTAIEKLEKAGCSKIMCTNTIKRPMSCISVAPAIARKIQEIL